MKIIECDFHTRYQQIAMMDEATGELIERRRVRQPLTFAWPEPKGATADGIFLRNPSRRHPACPDARATGGFTDLRTWQKCWPPLHRDKRDIGAKKRIARNAACQG